MNFKTTIFLLVLVVLVGGYFVFVERKAPTTQERQENAAQSAATENPTIPGMPPTAAPTGMPLFTADQLSTEKIDAVTVEVDGKKMVLKKSAAGGSGGSGGDWMQVAPVRFPLNTWSVQGVIDAAAGLRYTRKLTPGEKEAPSLDKLVLTSPKTTVTLTAGGDKPATFTVKVGRTTLGGRGFVMVGNDPSVYVVNDSLHKLLLDQNLNAWRRKTLQAPAESQAERVTLVRNGRAVEVVKWEGNWSFAPPQSGRVDTKAVASLLTGVTGIYIDQFVADSPGDLSAYGLDHPATILTVALPPATPASQPASKPANAPAVKPIIKTLRIGSPVDLTKESYYATWDDGETPGTPGTGSIASGGQVVFTIPKTSVEKFAKGVDDLRDPRITPLAAADVRSLTVVKRAGYMMNLTRGPAGWQFGPVAGIPGVPSSPAGPGFQADNNEVSNLVDSIVDAKATGYVPMASIPPLLGATAATLTLGAIGHSEPDVLKISKGEPGKNGEDRWLVVRNNEPTGYLVPADKLPAATVTAQSLRDRVALNLPLDRLKKIVIGRLVFERTVPPLPTTKPAGTQPAKPQNAPAPGPWKLDGSEKFESAAFESMLKSLSPLRVEAWTGPWQPLMVGMEMSLEAAEGATTRLQINIPTREGAINGSAEGFRVSKALLDQITQEFRDRTVLPIAAADIKKVAVTRGGKTLKIHKDDEGRYVTDDDQKLNQAAAGALFDTLAGLRVERYIPWLQPAKSDLGITIETQSNQKIDLAFHTGSAEAQIGVMSGSLGEKEFRVSNDAMKKLGADLIDKNQGQEKDKSGSEDPGAGD